MVRLSFWSVAGAAALAVASAAQGAGPSGQAQPVELVPARAADLLREVAGSGGRVVLVNVWATWCAPCLEELPDLLRLEAALRGAGFRLLLVSGDFPSEREAAGRFLARLGFGGRSFIKDGPDMEFIEGLEPRWSGALPASFLYDGSGRVLEFWEGKLAYEALEGRVRRWLDAGRTGEEENKR